MKIACPSCGFQNIEGEDRCAQCLHTLHQRDIPLPKKNDKIQSVMMTAPISDLITANPEFVKPGAPIAFVVNKRAMGGYRHVPVLREDGTPLSIILIKDVLE